MPNDSVSPGSARYGNFPDYYKFNSVTERMQYITQLTNIHFDGLQCRKTIRCIDIGCNTGDLTLELYQWLSSLLQLPVQVRGVDIDENLIQCAQAKYAQHYPQVCFEQFDLMSRGDASGGVLKIGETDKADVIFCFSVTLWIHINHGDAGLDDFLMNISNSCQYLVLESQPWKCYRTAARRAKRAGQPPFPYYDKLSVRGNVTDYIDKFLVNQCAMSRVVNLGNTNWGRDIVLYKNT